MLLSASSRFIFLVIQIQKKKHEMPSIQIKTPQIMNPSLQVEKTLLTYFSDSDI